MSSLSGKAATAGSSIYNATKFGLRGFAGALRAELRPHGVGVSAVFPGFIREAGMFAESGVKLPAGVGTRTPQDVADAVVSAIERNRGEVDVAPLSLRLGATFSGIAPEISATVTRRMGGERSPPSWPPGSTKSAEIQAEPRPAPSEETLLPVPFGRIRPLLTQLNRRLSLARRLLCLRDTANGPARSPRRTIPARRSRSAGEA